MGWFWAEYRRHPVWAGLLVLLLVVGLTADFVFLRKPESLTSSPASGVPVPSGTE